MTYHMRITPHGNSVERLFEILDTHKSISKPLIVEEHGEKEGGKHYHMLFDIESNARDPKDALIKFIRKNGVEWFTGQKHYTCNVIRKSEEHNRAYLLKGTRDSLPVIKVNKRFEITEEQIEEMHDQWWSVSQEIEEKKSRKRESESFTTRLLKNFITYFKIEDMFKDGATTTQLASELLDDDDVLEASTKIEVQDIMDFVIWQFNGEDPLNARIYNMHIISQYVIMLCHKFSIYIRNSHGVRMSQRHQLDRLVYN